jgi:hypothetical protein
MRPLVGFLGGSMVVVRTRKGGIFAGIFMVAVGWAFKLPMLTRWVVNGLISTISFLLLFCTVISLLVAARSVHLGKRGLVPFLLHIVFATLACFTTHFVFAVPLAIGIFVAISALVWPASSLQGVSGEQGAGESK